MKYLVTGQVRPIGLMRGSKVSSQVNIDAGSFPPIAHKQRCPTYMDARVLSAASEVFAGGGDPNFMMRVFPDQLMQLSNAKVVDLALGSVKKVDPLASAIRCADLGCSFTIPPPSFILDSMLGRLARWLRVIGVDAELPTGVAAAEYISHNHVQNSLQSHFLIDWANASNRILLTRDRKVLQSRRCCALLFLPFNDTPQQFECLARHFQLRWVSCCANAVIVYGLPQRNGLQCSTARFDEPLR
jgi:hypothetical protein